MSKKTSDYIVSGLPSVHLRETIEEYLNIYRDDLVSLSVTEIAPGLYEVAIRYRVAHRPMGPAVCPAIIDADVFQTVVEVI